MTSRSAGASCASAIVSRALPAICSLTVICTLLLRFEAGERQVLFDDRLGHRRQAAGDELLQVETSERASDREAAAVGLHAILLVRHQPQIGFSQELQPLGGQSRRSD